MYRPTLNRIETRDKSQNSNSEEMSFKFRYSFGFLKYNIPVLEILTQQNLMFGNAGHIN